MGNKRAVIGAGLMAVLAVAALVSAFTNDTPVIVLVLLLVFGAATLVSVGMWAAGRGRRTSMRVAAGATVLMALMTIPPLIMPDTGSPGRVFFSLFIIGTVIAVVLARPELGGRQAEQSSGARVA